MPRKNSLVFFDFVASFFGVHRSLTTGTDAITGTSANDTINAFYSADTDNVDNGSTITAFDSIDGAEGTDTLSIVITDADATTGDTVTDGDLATLGLTVSNVENVTVSSTVDLAFDEDDLSGFTNLTVNGTTGDVDVELDTATAATVSTTGAVTLTDNNAAGEDVLASASVSKATGAIAVSSDALTSLTLTDTTGAATVTAAAGTRALTVDLNGTTSALTDNTATGVTINTAGSDAITSTVSFDAATALTVAAAADVTLTADDATALDLVETLTVSGAGDFTADVSGADALATVAASASTGDVDVTIAATATAVTTGAGADTVTQAAALGATQAIDAGAGDDTVVLGGALTAGATVDGGAGTDSLSLTSAVATGATADTEEAVFSNFEDIAISNALGGNLNMANLDDIQSLTLEAGTGAHTVSGLNSNASVNFEATSAGALTVDVTDADVNTDDVLNVNIAGGAAITVAGVTVADVETININSDDTVDDNGVMIAHSATLTAAAAETIVVTGDAGLTLTYTGTTATNIDASALTIDADDATPLGFTWTSGALAEAATITGSSVAPNTVNFSAATKAVTYTGGTGVDTVTANGADNTINTGEGDDVITLGAGANTVNAGAGDDTINLSTGLDVVTGGAGDDTFVAAITTNGNIYTEITDFAEGDSLDLSALDAGSAGAIDNETLGDAVSLAGTAVFQDYLDAAAAATDAATATADVNWFQFGGDTYVVVDQSDNATFDNGTDSVIKLSGLIDLSEATSAAAVVTL